MKKKNMYNKNEKNKKKLKTQSILWKTLKFDKPKINCKINNVKINEIIDHYYPQQSRESILE